MTLLQPARQLNWVVRRQEEFQVTAHADLPALPLLEWDADSSYWCAEGVSLPPLSAEPLWVAVVSADSEQDDPTPAQQRTAGAALVFSGFTAHPPRRR